MTKLIMLITGCNCPLATYGTYDFVSPCTLIGHVTIIFQWT